MKSAREIQQLAFGFVFDFKLNFPRNTFIVIISREFPSCIVCWLFFQFSTEFPRFLVMLAAREFDGKHLQSIVKLLFVVKDYKEMTHLSIQSSNWHWPGSLACNKSYKVFLRNTLNATILYTDLNTQIRQQQSRWNFRNENNFYLDLKIIKICSLFSHAFNCAEAFILCYVDWIYIFSFYVRKTKVTKVKYRRKVKKQNGNGKGSAEGPCVKNTF